MPGGSDAAPRSCRWPPPAQRADETVDNRGVSRTPAGKPADSDGRGDHRSRRICRAFDFRALSGPARIEGRGDRRRHDAGVLPGGHAAQRRRSGRASELPCRGTGAGLPVVAAAMAGPQCGSGRIGGAGGANQAGSSVDRSPDRGDVPAGALVARRSTASADHLGDRGPDRLRELGPHAGGLRPVIRRCLRHLAPGYRSPSAADAADFLTLRPPERRKARFVGGDPRWRP